MIGIIAICAAVDVHAQAFWQGAKVAVKIILCNSDDRLQDSVAEAITARMLAHPYIVNSYAAAVLTAKEVAAAMEAVARATTCETPRRGSSSESHGAPQRTASGGARATAAEEVERLLATSEGTSEEGDAAGRDDSEGGPGASGGGGVLCDAEGYFRPLDYFPGGDLLVRGEISAAACSAPGQADVAPALQESATGPTTSAVSGVTVASAVNDVVRNSWTVAPAVQIRVTAVSPSSLPTSVIVGNESPPTASPPPPPPPPPPATSDPRPPPPPHAGGGGDGKRDDFSFTDPLICGQEEVSLYDVVKDMRMKPKQFLTVVAVSTDAARAVPHGRGSECECADFSPFSYDLPSRVFVPHLTVLLPFRWSTVIAAAWEPPSSAGPSAPSRDAGGGTLRCGASSARPRRWRR